MNDMTKADLAKEFDLTALRRYMKDAAPESDPRVTSALAGLGELKAAFLALPDSDPRLTRLLAAYGKGAIRVTPSVSKIIARFCFEASAEPEIDAFIETLTSALEHTRPQERPRRGN